MHTRIRLLVVPILLMALCGCVEPFDDVNPLDPQHDWDGDGFTEDDGDCNDDDADVHPDATEACNGVDDDCDGLLVADELDADGDGYVVCEWTGDDPAVLGSDDCDDGDTWLNPMDADGDGFSTCDGDCDDTDEGLDPADLDADGYSSCDEDCDDTDPSLEPADLDGDLVSTCNGDCDDMDSRVHPGASDVCDGVLDNDCDGVPDPAETDDDADGYTECEGDCDDQDSWLTPDDLDGDGYSSCAGDCDDNNLALSPAAAEVCNGVDDDCDGSLPSDEVDDDGDGYLACEECDDTDAALNHDDGDGDGYSTCDGDCADGDPTYNPADFDGDGFSSCQGDCDDYDDTLTPEDWDADGLSSCDGDCDDADATLNLEDADGDGFTSCDSDCDDGDAATYPGATEVCDAVDNDCDGLLPLDEQDGDGDGYATCEGDCDDTSDAVSPEADEACDGVDNDCDGTADLGGCGATVVFVSTARHDGAFGGRAGLDTFCAGNVPAGLSSTNIHAFIGADIGDAIADLPVNYGYDETAPLVWFRSSDGAFTEFAVDWADALDSTIAVDRATGTGVDMYAWTGSDGAGAFLPNERYHCVNWTSNAKSNRWTGQWSYDGNVNSSVATMPDVTENWLATSSTWAKRKSYGPTEICYNGINACPCTEPPEDEVDVDTLLCAGTAHVMCACELP